MAISFIGSARAGSAANTDTTITLPGGMATDDLIIVAYGIGDNDSVDQNVAMVTAGYTEVADLLGNNAGTQDVSFGVYYKYHNGSDTTAVCDALAAGTDAAVVGVCMVFRGVALAADGGPFEITSTTATGNGFSPDPPSVSGFTEATSWIVIAGGGGDLAGGTGLVSDDTIYTNPTGYTGIIANASFGDSSDVTAGLGVRTTGISDPENPGIMTRTGTDDTTNYTWCAVTMVLKAPAAAVEAAQFHTSYRSIYPGPTTN